MSDLIRGGKEISKKAFVTFCAAVIFFLPMAGHFVVPTLAHLEIEEKGLGQEYMEQITEREWARIDRVVMFAGVCAVLAILLPWNKQNNI